MADRSVSVSLRAKVAEFIAGMNAAKNSTQDLSRKMTETGASADQMRRRLEAATRALPKITIDADSTPAEIKFAQLRRELESLSEKRIGIDVDAATAMAQIRTIEQELAQLERDETNVNVKADIGTALAELRAMQGEVNRLDGQNATVNVNANVAGALASIALVGAALASLPAAAAMAVGVGAIGGAFAAAGAGAAGFAAVAVPSLGRINEALKQQQTAAGGAGGATKSAGQAAATAAQQAMQLDQAERRVTDAQKQVKLAQEDLTRAREDAKRALEDLTLSVKDAALAEEDAALSVAEARQRLAEVQADPKASELERQRAELNYRQAVQRLEDQQVRTKRLQEDQTKAAKAGVEGSDQVRSAQDKLAKSQQAVADAVQQLKVLQLQQAAAMQAAGGAAGGAASKFGELTKAEQEMAREIKGVQDAYVAWQRSLEGDVFPAISGGLDLVMVGLPKISPLVKSASGAFVGLEKDAKAALEGPFWNTFLFNLNTQIPTAITGLGHIGGDVFHGLAGVVQAFLPYVDDIVAALERGSSRFATWGENLGSSGGFHQFLLYVRETGPVVVETLTNLATTGATLVQALAPFGSLSLTGLKLLSDLLAGMSPGEIQAVAIAIGAVYGAVKSGQAINSAVGELGNLRKRIDEAGGAAGGTKSKLSAMAGLLGAGGPWGVAIGAGIGALGLFAAKHAEAEQRVHDLSDAIRADSGVIGENTQAKVINTLRTGGMLEIADRFGISMATLTSAATGNKGALAQVNEQLGKMSDQTKGLHPVVGALGDQTKVLGGDALQLWNQLTDTNSELGKASKEAKLTEEAFGSTGAAADGAAGKVGNLNNSLSTFASRTDAAAALNGLKKAFDDAKKAIDDSTHGLDLNAKMTDVEREAVIRAREQFGGYITKVAEAAQKQSDLAKATGNAAGASDAAKAAVLGQLDGLFKLAGNSKEARDQIYSLAQQYGISKKEADKATSSAKALRDMIAQLKSKTVIITLEERYKQAQKTEQQRNSADGNVFRYHAEGGIERFAAGSENHVAQIAPANTIRVWAEPETQGEAYIPLASSKRVRSTQILGAVAGEFGYALIPADRISMASSIPAGGMVMAGSASRSLPISGTGSGGTNSLPSRRSAPQMGNPAAYGGAPYSAGAAQSGSLAGRLAHDAAGGGSKGSSPTIHIENYHPPDGASPRLIAEDLNFIGRRS